MHLAAGCYTYIARLSQPSSQVKHEHGSKSANIASCHPKHDRLKGSQFPFFLKPRGTMSEQGMSRSWSGLPMSALTLTFEKLPFSQRAGSADCVARVCSSWAEAAAAATSSIVLKPTSTDSLQRWLHSRGASVRQISLNLVPKVFTALPRSNLQCLMLTNSRVDLRTGSHLLQDLCSATTLTKLYFSDVDYQGDPDLAAVLLALPNLQVLGLLPSQERFFRVHESPQEQQQPSKQLQASTSSVRQYIFTASLQLWSAYGDPLASYRCFTDHSMQFVCKLTKLVRLHLGSMQGVTAAGLAGLHKIRGLKTLTLLDLTCDIGLTAVPAFTQLTHLTALTLAWVKGSPRCEFEPSILAHRMQLEHLVLHGCTPARGKAGAAELLSRLSQMPVLRKLDLKYIDGLEQCPSEAFLSLTPSSMLESLVWAFWTLFWDEKGPWRHMFPDKLQMSALTQLYSPYAMPWEAPDLDRLVSSCSHLQKLSLCCHPGLQLTALLRLTALTRLQVTGATEDSTPASLVQLSALQRLQELSVRPCSFIGDDAVRSLTALTQLTCLGLSDLGVFSTTMKQLLQRFGRENIDGGFACHPIKNTAPAGKPPNVWSQLLSCCEACAALSAQPNMGAPDVAVDQQQGQEQAPAAPQQHQQQVAAAAQQQVGGPPQQQQEEEVVEQEAPAAPQQHQQQVVAAAQQQVGEAPQQQQQQQQQEEEVVVVVVVEPLLAPPQLNQQQQQVAPPTGAPVPNQQQQEAPPPPQSPSPALPQQQQMALVEPWQVPAGVPPDGGPLLAAQQHWQRWWQLCRAAVALMAVAVPMLLLWLQSLGLQAA